MKIKTSFLSLFYSKAIEAALTWAVSNPSKLLPQDMRLSIRPTTGCEQCLHLFCASLNKMHPKIIASLFWLMEVSLPDRTAGEPVQHYSESNSHRGQAHSNHQPQRWGVTTEHTLMLDKRTTNRLILKYIKYPLTGSSPWKSDTIFEKKNLHSPAMNFKQYSTLDNLSIWYSNRITSPSPLRIIL